jgi:hypothetical protein
MSYKIVYTRPGEFNGIILLFIRDGNSVPLVTREVRENWIKDRGVYFEETQDQIIGEMC